MAKKKDEKADKPAAKGDKSEKPAAAKGDKGDKPAAAKGDKGDKPGAKGDKGDKGKGGAAKPAEQAPEKASESLASKVVEGVKSVVGAIAEKLGVTPEAQPAAQPAGKRHGFRRKLVGRVTSNKMDKTVTVEVIRDARDPVYKKYVRMRDRYKAHDETNQYKVGDRVEITEHRPISRDKRWLVTRLVARPVEE
jgi:small subunit ribosomal protein S17